VTEPEDGHDKVAQMFGILFARDIADTGAGHAGLGGKQKCLAHRQVRKVDIGLGVVDDLAPEVTVHDIRWNSLILDVGRGLYSKTWGEVGQGGMFPGNSGEPCVRPKYGYGSGCIFSRRETTNPKPSSKMLSNR
jgi:hypothetical protein